MDVNWNGIYGVGKGAAQVFQGNPALDDLRKNIALNQQRKAQEDAQFNAGLAKLNFKGAKNADFGELTKQYQDILNTHAQLRNTDNLAQRQQLQQQLQQKQQGLLYDINQSSEHNTQEQKLADVRLNPNADIVDDFIPKVSALQQMPSIGKGYNGYQNAYQQTTSNIFAPKWDAYKESADLAKGLVNTGKPEIVETVDPRTGMINKAVTAKQTFDKDAFITNYVARAAKSPQAARAAVLATGEQDPADAIYAQANQLADFYTKGLETKSEDKSGGQTIASKIALHNANRDYDQAHPLKEPKGAKVIDPTYFQDLSERMRQGIETKTNNGSGEEFNNQVANNPAYLHGLTINKDNPKAVVLTVPAKYHQIKNPNADQTGQPQFIRAVQTPSYNVTLDSTDPTQWHAGFARVYKDITGDATAAPSKAMTQGGKGKVVGGLTNPNQRPINQAKQPQIYKVKGKEYKADAVLKAAQASGMTVDEYLREVNK